MRVCQFLDRLVHLIFTLPHILPAPPISDRVSLRLELRITHGDLAWLLLTQMSLPSHPLLLTVFPSNGHALNIGGLPTQIDTLLLEKQQAFDRSKLQVGLCSAGLHTSSLHGSKG